MKITKIECIPVTSPYKKPFVESGTIIRGTRNVVVKVHTDEGITGVGESGGAEESIIGDTQDSITGIINDILGPQIILGEDPFKIERIVAKMDRAAIGHNQAKAAIDFALHDIMGKKLGVPVYQLLGGLTIEKIPLGFVMSSGTPEEMAAEAVKLLKAGFHSLKLKVGAHTAEEDIETVRVAREAVGSDVKLFIDVNGGWNYIQALGILKKMEKYDLFMVEQPLPWWDLDGLARLRRKVGIPIFLDESAKEPEDILKIIEKDAADGLLLKVVKAGGLLKSQRWVTLAQAADLPVICGCVIGGGFETAASAHFIAANDWMGKLEHAPLGPLMIHDVLDTVTVPIKNDIAETVPRYENGFLYPPHSPGIGAELNEAVIPRLITPGKRPTVIGN